MKVNWHERKNTLYVCLTFPARQKSQFNHTLHPSSLLVHRNVSQTTRGLLGFINKSSPAKAWMEHGGRQHAHCLQRWPILQG